MPSFPYTPASLTLTGGSFALEPVLFAYEPARLRVTGGGFAIGPTLTTDLASAFTSILDTLFAGEAIVDAQGRPTRRYQQIWQNAMEGIKQILTTQGGSISSIQDVLAALTQTQAIAATAAQTANTVAARIDLANSYTDPANVLTASSAGAVTISAHDRVYDNGTRVAVDGGSLSGFTSGQFVRVYYIDPSREGGAVTYRATTGDVVQAGDQHIVGGVTIPAAGEVDTTGAGTIPPGYVPDYGAFLPFAI